MKRTHLLGAMIIALFFVVFLMGCEVTEKTITSIEVDASSIQDTVDIADFDVSDLKIKVVFSDDTFEVIEVTESMIAQADLSKLTYMGHHEIHITYEGFNLTFTIELTDALTLANLMTFYNYAVSTLGFSGTYDAWILNLLAGGSETIRSAVFNSSNELILTLSNAETVNLGQMITETVTVTFYGFNGELLTTVVIPKGGSAIPPSAPLIEDYNFNGWEGIFNNVMVDTEIHAIYLYTGQPISSIDDADELIISLTRLEEAEFGVDLDAIFSSTTNTQSTSRMRSLGAIIKEGTMMDTSDNFNPSSYIPHTYWNQMYYNPGLYQLPPVVEGFHVITSTLTSYSSHALNNLYEVNSQVAQSSRQQADWAVDYLTVMDTWVIQDDFKYLLHYDEQLDRVELYNVWTYAELSITAYRKIFVYYNEKGEEVVETWDHQLYTDPLVPGYPGVMVYHNAIAGRDFNYYAIWLDEDHKPSTMRHYRGINMNEEGYYEYYDNNMLMVSGDYGWYTIIPSVNLEQESITFNDNPFITIYSPDATSDVMTIYGSEGSYFVEVSLPSMTGVDALLVEEGGMIKKNQDSESTQQFLLDEGYALMPDWYEMDRWDLDVDSGFQTSNGTFYAQHGNLTGDVTLQYVYVEIGSEGTRDYDLYHNYYGKILINIQASTLDDLVDKLTGYMNDVGLSYKFGDTAELFEELAYIYENYQTIGEGVSIVHDGLSLPSNRYTSYEDYQLSEAAMVNYLDIESLLLSMLAEKPSMSFSELPSKNDLNAISLISTNNSLTGQLRMTEEGLITTALTGTLRRSPLLQNNQSYSLYYALQVGGRLIEIGHEIPQIFTGQDLSFTGNITMELPGDLMVGEYHLVVFYAKVVGDAYLRISNPVAWQVQDLVGSSVIVKDDEYETATETKIINDGGRLVMIVSSIDAYAPKVTVEYDDTIYQFEQTINELLLPEGTTVDEFLKMITIQDNVDGKLEPTLSQLTKEQLPVQLTDLMMGGVWVYEVSDAAGLKTKITIVLVNPGYTVTWMVDDEIYQEVIVAPDTTITQIPVPEKEGHTIVGWDSENLVISANQVYHAIYTVNTYKVTWMYDEQVIREDSDVPYGTVLTGPDMPSIEGHYFQWQLTGGGTMPAGDIIVIGDYQKHLMTITYYIDGTYFGVQEVYYGDPITPLEVTPPQGKVFSGWDLTYTTMPFEHLVANGSLTDPQAS